LLSRDVLGSGVASLSQVIPQIGDHVTELNLNCNELYSLDGIAAYSSLLRVSISTVITTLSIPFITQLSVQQNHLVNVTAIRSLDQLVWLDLQNNSLTDVAGNMYLYVLSIELCFRFSWFGKFKVGVSGWQQYPGKSENAGYQVTIAVTTALCTSGQ